MDPELFQQQQQQQQHLMEQFAALQLEMQRLQADNLRLQGALHQDNQLLAQNNMPRLKVPKYDGAEHRLEPWLSQARDILSVMRWPHDSPASVQLVAVSLEGKARTAWDCHVSEHGVPASFDAFCTVMHDIVGPKNTDITGRRKLRTLHQDRSVRAYTDQFLRIVRTFRTPMADLDLREHYIGGLKRDAMQYARQAIPADGTFREAINAALLFDGTIRASESSASAMDLGSIQVSHGRTASASPASSRAPSRSPSPAPRPSSYHRHSRTHRTASPAVRFRSDSPGSQPERLAALTSEERDRLFREKRCFRCRKSGHMAYNCPMNSDPKYTQRKN